MAYLRHSDQGEPMPWKRLDSPDLTDWSNNVQQTLLLTRPLPKTVTDTPNCIIGLRVGDDISSIMSDSVRVKDYRGLEKLTAEQMDQLKLAKEADQQQRKQHSAAAAYTFVDDQSTAKLSSGHSIPLVGLGTW